MKKETIIQIIIIIILSVALGVLIFYTINELKAEKFEKTGGKMEIGGTIPE